METKSIVGSFKTDGNYLQLARELADKGFVRGDVIVEGHTEEVFLISLAVNSDEDLKKAIQVFEKFKPYHTYEFPFVAENKSRLRDYVRASAKTKIFNLPKVTAHGHNNDGLNSEVVVGKQ